jgi:hypothetical protein
MVEEVEVTVTGEALHSEAGSELFKNNMVLVMAASGYWSADELTGSGDCELWPLTWKKVRSFSPGGESSIGLYEEMMILIKAHFVNNKEAEKKEVKVGGDGES